MSSSGYVKVTGTQLDHVSNELIKIARGDNPDDKVKRIISLCQIIKAIPDKSQLIISFELLKTLRMMLVDSDKNLRAQTCRSIRYITCNQLVLTQMVGLNIPYFMMMCLEREDDKYYWERLFALKWVRLLIDQFPLSIPKVAVMSLIGIASNGKHQYRRICLDFLREICIINPGIVSQCNGFKTLIELILHPTLTDVSNSLLLTVLYILDHPNTRKYLRPSLDVQRLLRPFVDVNPHKKNALNKQQIENRNKTREIARNTLMTMLKSITGIFYLGGEHHGGVKSQLGGQQSFIRIMVDLLKLPNEMSGIQWARHQMMDVLEHALLPLSDSSKLERIRGPNLMVNYVCLILMALIRNDLIECLVDVGMRSDLVLAPRARTLLQRIQFLSAKYLPPAICSRICSIETVIRDAATFESAHKLHKSNLEVTVQRNFANMMISELTEDANADLDGDDKYNLSEDEDDSDNEDLISAQTVCHQLGPQFDLNSTFIRYRYMLDRDIPTTMMFRGRIPYHSHRNRTRSQQLNNSTFQQFSFKTQRASILEKLKGDQNASYSERQIVEKLDATNVLKIKNADEWNVEALWEVLNGPLWNEYNLNVAIRSRFIKKVLTFLKPSKQFFCLYEWKKERMRYAQCAVQLFRIMTSCDLGTEYQPFQEVVEEIFDCLKDQIEANLKKTIPQKAYSPFSRHSIANTLSRVYVVLIGVLSESERGMGFFRKYGLFAFLFPLTKREITEHQMTDDRIVGPNDYLLRLIGTNLDYTVDGEFPLLFSKWIAKGSYYLRKTLITHLELLYRAQMPKFDEWSISILSLLLQSEQRLALTALKVLEKINLSQNSIKSHQYLVDLIRTSPTDEVIGQYGQFLFIKMLSTVEGLQFLESSKWLSRKRKEWIDRMHTKYTNMLETALFLSVSNESNASNDVDEQNQKELRSKMMRQRQQQQQQNGKRRGGPNASDSPNGMQRGGGGGDDSKLDEEEQESVADEDAEQWLPYHLIYENRSDEEELYAEYLSHFPWTLRVKVLTPAGNEMDVNCDAFFDSNCFYYRHHRRSPVSLGQGVHGIILDQYGASSPYQLVQGSKIQITLDLGHGCLSALYGSKRLTKVVALSQMLRYNECGVIAAPELGLFCFFDEFNVRGCGLTRIFWSLDESMNSKLKQNSLVRPLPHFYGELAKTTEGCTYILSHHEFNIDLQTFILTVHSAFTDMMAMKGVDRARDDTPNGPPNQARGPQPDTDNFTYDSQGGLVDNNSNLQLRSCLWALGQIGSSKTGLRLLNSLCNEMNDINIIDDICILTKASQTLSIRGTCLYVLGLLSRTDSGMKQLRKHGFGFPADNLELDLAVAIPEDIDDFFEMATTHYVESAFLQPGNLRICCTSPPELCRPGNMKPMDPNELMGKQGRTEETVLAHISSLCNNVTQKSSASALHRLRTKKPSVFTNPLLFREALKLMNQYQFKLAAKRFVVFTLFDQVILDEESEALNLFDSSLDDAILPFKEIREWRYQYRQRIEEKHRLRHAQRQHSRSEHDRRRDRSPYRQSGHSQQPQHSQRGNKSNRSHHQQKQQQQQQHQQQQQQQQHNSSAHRTNQRRDKPRSSSQPRKGTDPPPRQVRQQAPLFQVHEPEALPDDDEPDSLHNQNGAAVPPVPGSSMRSPAPPPLKPKNRTFANDRFPPRQRSNDQKAPPKPPQNRPMSSKSDATAAYSPSKQKEIEKEQAKKPQLTFKRSNSTNAAFATSSKKPKMINRGSYDRPLPPGGAQKRSSRKRDSLKTKRRVSGGIGARLAQLQANANNGGGAFGGDWKQKDGKLQELAQSPTDEVAGPNPLQNLPSQNQYQ